MLVFLLELYSSRQSGCPGQDYELGNYTMIMLSRFNWGAFWMTQSHSQHLCLLFFNQRLRSQLPDTETRASPTLVPGMPHDSAQSRKPRSSSLWGEERFLRTEFVLFVALGPFHLFLWEWRGYFVRSDMKWSRKQEAAKRLDLKGLKPLWAAGCNSSGSCLHLRPQGLQSTRLMPHV